MVAPTSAFIDFRCHWTDAKSTVQVALNDSAEYQGGRLCFFVNDQLHVLERPAGSTCQYPAKVLHGVSVLTQGSRKSLFVLDESNGLGDTAVQEVTLHDVQRFQMLEEAPRVQMCCVRLTTPSDHVLLPCGHLCLCNECVEDVDNCPLCKTEVDIKRRVYV